MNASVGTLAGDVLRTRAALDSAVGAWRAAWQVRQTLITEMRASESAQSARVARDVPAADTSPAGLPTPRGALGQPDASPRTVQNLLFVLGGILLAIGAIVFTAVAWATYGVPGRAAVLGAATVIALVVPLIAVRRRLIATAETVAAVGLLLVALDGYGLWTLNVFHVAAHFAASTYAGVVAAVVTAVAWLYGRFVRLVGPRFAALVALQPVLPLLTATHVATATTIAWCYAGVALVDLGIVTLARRGSTSPDLRAAHNLATALIVVAWMFAGLALATATVAAFTAITISNGTTAVERGVGAVAIAGLILLSAGRLARTGIIQALVVGAAIVEIGVAIVRLGITATPIYPLAVASLVVLATVAAARLVRPGSWVAAGLIGAARVATAALGLVVIGWLAQVTILRAAAVSERSSWHAVLGGLTSPAGPAGHPIATAAVVVAAIAIVPAPHHRWVGVPGLALLGLSVGCVVGMPWWGMLIADGVTVVALLAVAALALPRRFDQVAAIALVATAVLIAHALWFGLARPAATAAVFGGIGACAAGFVLATRTAQALRRYAKRPVVWAGRGCAVAIGLSALPGFAASLSGAAGGSAIVDLRAASGAVVVELVALLLVRIRPHIRWYATGAVTVVATIIGFTAPAVTTIDAAGIYGVFAVLVATLAALTAGFRGRYALIVASPAALLTPLVVIALVDVIGATFVTPYEWLAHTWTGAPSGVGLTPNGTHLDGMDLATALVAATTALIVALAVSGRRAVPRYAWHAIAPVAVAILAVARAPWPTVPAIVLVVGAAGVIRAAFAPRHRGWEFGVTGVVLVGAAVSALTPTKVSTLCALGAATVVSVVAACSAHTSGRRVAGWIAGVAIADTFAIASTLAGGADIGTAAYGILGVAAVAMFVTATPVLRVQPVAPQASERTTMTAVVIRQWRAQGFEARAVMAAAQASAAIALDLSGSATRAAIIAAIWGVLVGIRALPVDISQAARMWWVCAAAALEVFAWWLLAAAHNVRTVEAYTLPFAAVALLAGWLAARQRALNSWLAYGVALLAAFLPSLAPALSLDASPARRLIVGLAALAVVLVGAYFRLQAPVVVGGVTIFALALHEIVLVSRLLPTWAPLTAAGIVVLACAITYERRRRDLTRLRDVISRMA